MEILAIIVSIILIAIFWRLFLSIGVIALAIIGVMALLVAAL